MDHEEQKTTQATARPIFVRVSEAMPISTRSSSKQDAGQESRFFDIPANQAPGKVVWKRLKPVIATTSETTIISDAQEPKAPTL